MNNITINLSNAEAIVLFEMLSQFEEEETALPLEDQAEEFALWRLHGFLQKALVEPFHPDWIAILKSSRDELRRRYGE